MLYYKDTKLGSRRRSRKGTGAKSLSKPLAKAYNSAVCYGTGKTAVMVGVIVDIKAT